MPADLDLIVPATTRGLHAALQALEKTCAARSVSADLLSRARIVVEELFTNTMKYGYGGECDRPLRLCLEVASDLTLTIEDEAPPFDPTRWLATRDTRALPSERPVGQSGIAMVFGLSSKVNYQRLPVGNRTTVVIEPH
jgi:anti-sigma regulatory factor (Ser/Thr protein kinase)